MVGQRNLIRTRVFQWSMLIWRRMNFAWDHYSTLQKRRSGGLAEGPQKGGWGLRLQGLKVGRITTTATCDDGAATRGGGCEGSEKQARKTRHLHLLQKLELIVFGRDADFGRNCICTETAMLWRYV